MKSFSKRLIAMALFFTLVIFACVTINIYFPAEKVQSVAGEIVDEIRGGKADAPRENGPQNSFLLKETMLAFLKPCAVAAEPLTVSNPTIRILKQRMRQRYAQMKPYYQSNILREDNNGYVSLAKPGGLSLREKRTLNSLVAAENSDRKKLYTEIAKALNIDASQVDRIGRIFAKEWQKPVR